MALGFRFLKYVPMSMFCAITELAERKRKQQSKLFTIDVELSLVQMNAAILS
jgi:hypothetical protein